VLGDDKMSVMLMQDILSDINKHILKDERPSIYLDEIAENSTFNKFPLEMLNDLKKAEQSPKHHPEGNVWKHTMLVVDEAAIIKEKSSHPRAFMWAALLHDIGKPGTTKIRNGKITSYDHDKLGAELARKFMAEYTDDREFIETVAELIRWHMQILFVVNNLPFANLKTMKRKTDIHEIALLGLCDRMGRLGVDRRKEEENILRFLEKCMEQER
jgi:putative nucleotidyltransferase with HDIG domain